MIVNKYKPTSVKLSERGRPKLLLSPHVISQLAFKKGSMVIMVITKAIL